MHDRKRLQVELYVHGGWWKDSAGRTGQVDQAHARKGPLATVAALSNIFGMDGWELIDFASAQHNSYWLSFALLPDEEDKTPEEEHPPVPSRSASICLG